MRQIIYMGSLVSSDFHELRSTVQSSFDAATHSGIRGMTLYCEGNIVQALEGKKDAVNAMFSAILVDARYVGIHVLLEERIDHSAFETWSFGFKSLKKSEVEKWNLQGDWFKATDKEIVARVRRGNALTVLRSFFSD
jgi:hypothetical protein